jgi:intracellular septation protein
MKLILDFFPILLFFGAFKLYDIYIATGVLMTATVLQMAIIWYSHRRLEPMQQATLVLILLFGSLTLVLHDDRFIKWKPTVLYGAMALALAVAFWGFRKNFLEAMLGKQLQLPHRIWTHLNVAWIGYCVFMAAINGYVAAYFSTEAWVNFKLWGYAFPIVFLIAQGLYISPHLESDDEPAA